MFIYSFWVDVMLLRFFPPRFVGSLCSCLFIFYPLLSLIFYLSPSSTVNYRFVNGLVRYTFKLRYLLSCLLQKNREIENANVVYFSGIKARLVIVQRLGFLGYDAVIIDNVGRFQNPQ